MSARMGSGTARMFEYRVPPESIWSSGLSVHHVIAPIVEEPSVLELLDEVGVRRYGDEWARLRRVIGRSLRRVVSSSGLVELTRASTSNYVKIGKTSSLTVAVEVVELVYDPEATGAAAVVNAARAAGRRAGASEPMVRFVGSLAFRFSFHSVPGETNLGSVVSSSGATRYAVFIPAKDTLSRRGESAGWMFSRLYPEGLPMMSSKLGPHGPVAETALPSSHGPESSGVDSSDVEWSRRPGAEGDRGSAGPRSVGLPSRMLLRESADGRSEIRFEAPSVALSPDSVLTPAAMSVPGAMPSTGVLSPNAADVRADLDAPIGDGFWVWGPAGEAGVRRLERLLHRAGAGASAVVAVLAEGSAEVDQYHVVHEGGGFRWHAEPSGLPTDPPRHAVSGASLIVDATGAPWNNTAPVDTTPKEATTVTEPRSPMSTDREFCQSESGASSRPEAPPTTALPAKTAQWFRSDALPRRLLVAEQGAAWHYLVDAEGEVLLTRAETDRRTGAGTQTRTRLQSPGVERPRVAGEMRWDPVGRRWEVDDTGGWHVDEGVRVELEADPDAPSRWLDNVAARLAEHLAVPTVPRLIVGVSEPSDTESPLTGGGPLPGDAGATLSEPAPPQPGQFSREPLPSLVAPTLTTVPPAPPESGLDLAGARLWDEPGQDGVRRLEETLLAAGAGARAAVVVFRSGQAAAERFQVVNWDGRLEWTFGLTGAATEPPGNVTLGASLVTGPDGALLPEVVSDPRHPNRDVAS